jgi:DNA mismatch endonuclease (patch repair protein)
MDILTPAQRSERMSRVGQKNTAPEVELRKILHAAGYRFRLHRKDLPGTPDIVLPRRRTSVFLHGCFWHGHSCRAGRAPSSNTAFWQAKIIRNKARDVQVGTDLDRLGWRTIVVWQCELKDRAALLKRMNTLLSSESDHRF